MPLMGPGAMAAHPGVSSDKQPRGNVIISQNELLRKGHMGPAPMGNILPQQVSSTKNTLLYPHHAGHIANTYAHARES